jgi:hypothetical protein
MALIDTKKFEGFSEEIFNLDSNIKYFAVIDLEGKVLVENSKNSLSFVNADADRIMFYHQIGSRRSKREDFDDVCGETLYIHIQRKKIQQLIVYLPAATIFLMIDNKLKSNELIKLVHKLQKIDKQKLNHVLNSILIHQDL